jgi:serine/threonine protein kinase
MADDNASQKQSTLVTHQCADVDAAAEVPTEVHPATEAVHATDVKLAESISASDVALVESGTAPAPSFRVPAPPLGTPIGPPPTIEIEPAAKHAPRDKTPLALLPGAKVDDFELVRLLGRGAFGHVYLARQLSLDRLVALKVSANRGSEGRTMARLEHQHIVQVFSEKVDLELNERLLCMQLVPGMGLDKLIGKLNTLKAGSHPEGAQPGAGSESQPPAPSPQPPAWDWSGAELLAIVDQSGSLPTALDPSALHDREALGKMDAVETTAWFGTRMAEALDFAHRNGVLHRDIKPANILVNPYGRPMLADFNISSQPIGAEPSGDEMFGGTFAYMAPEHLEAFNPDDPTGHEAVTSRSDIYSLGLVLQQLLEARIGFPHYNRKTRMADTLRAMSEERRRPAPICKPCLPSARMTLERSIGRCLEPNPDDRFASGAALGAQLDGCRHLREAERRLPKVPAMFAPILRHPFLWLVLLTLLPHFVGSVVNITYNNTQIIDELSEAQEKQFWRVVNAYNAIVYPIVIVIFVFIVRRVWRSWNKLSKAERLPDGEVQAARRQALRLPRLIAALTAFGWFPGGIIFPIAIMWTTSWDHRVFAHFVISFWFSGLIALAYSLCGVEFVVLRGLYPALWRDAQGFTETARRELSSVSPQLNRIHWLAVSIPLVAAIVFVLFSDDPSVPFRVMATSLIVLGIFGLYFTSAITNHLSRVLVALTNTKE